MFSVAVPPRVTDVDVDEPAVCRGVANAGLPVALAKLWLVVTVESFDRATTCTPLVATPVKLTSAVPLWAVTDSDCAVPARSARALPLSGESALVFVLVAVRVTAVAPVRVAVSLDSNLESNVPAVTLTAPEITEGASAVNVAAALPTPVPTPLTLTDPTRAPVSVTDAVPPAACAVERRTSLEDCCTSAGTGPAVVAAVVKRVA